MDDHWSLPIRKNKELRLELEVITKKKDGHLLWAQGQLACSQQPETSDPFLSGPSLASGARESFAKRWPCRPSAVQNSECSYRLEPRVSCGKLRTTKDSGEGIITYPELTLQTEDCSQV